MSIVDKTLVTLIMDPSNITILLLFNGAGSMGALGAGAPMKVL